MTSIFSQVESRIVYVLTGDPHMIELAHVRPHEADMHLYNAAAIFGIPQADLAAALALPKDDPAHKAAKEKRYLGKRAVHGAQRDMRGKRLAANLLNDGYVYTEDECDKIIDSYHSRFPAIRDGYFPAVRREIMRHKRLENSWGRVVDFHYNRLDNDLFREAYSWPPQAENADLMLQWGVKPGHAWMMERYGRPLNVTVYDSITASVLPEDAYDLALLLRDSLERPREYRLSPTYAAHSLVVPCEFTLGATWAGDFEFKQLPSRDEFTDAAIACAKKVMGREQQHAMA